MAFPTVPYHGDSDADDEYERSVLPSPHLPTDSETSPTDSDPPSTEHTPTTFGDFGHGHSSPRTLITQWTAEEVINFVSNLGLQQYTEIFLDNEIVGEALIALKHEELKEMGITSVGHRLTILKSVYDVKVKQDIPLESDHYVPLSADAAVQDATATKEDIARIIQSIELRDQRIVKAEAELRRVTEEYRKLRDELLPVFRMVKDKSHPLPYHPTGSISENQNYDQNAVPPPTSQQEKFAGLGRKLTNPGKLFLGLAPKNSSPTHIPPSATDNKSITDNANLDPSNAAVAAQNHLAASINGGSQPSTSPHQQNIPSPTSPPSYNSQQPTLGSKSYRDQTAPRQMFPHPEEPQYAYNNMNDRDRGNPTPTPRMQQRSEEPPSSGGSGTGGSSTAQNVEIFKSFRVSMDDPCHKVLPAALRKYNINADWRQYALYIVYGDQERCLGLDERPLILFKQLDREGKKPMFMLRKHAAPVEGHSGTVSSQPGSAGFENGQGNAVNMGRGQQYQNGIQLPQLPGGVL
ncbi:MAG: Adaptor for signal transduction [Candelina mexicana]|nr:MAG: Adaptor for signal transduction [Candelina mexicana]